MILDISRQLVSIFAAIDVPIWDIWIRILLKKGDAGKQLFSSIQKEGHQRQGFIICGWDNEGKPAWWWPYTGLTDVWERFDDDRISEEPHIFRKLETTLKRIQILREDPHRKGPEARIGLMFWQHPEATDKILPEYLELAEGSQFPGCPSQ